uniref:L-glutamate gamma-semialdehyde dehydrogenase n=1 Tax=Glossina austeni TaxID=7395 RepID=A0A1A9UKC7_GLOAU
MDKNILGIRLDDALFHRIEKLSRRINRTPNWLIKQAVFLHLDTLEKKAKSGKKIENTSTSHIEKQIIHEGNFSQPFFDFAQQILPQSYLRSQVTSAWSISETEIVPKLLNLANCDENTERKIYSLSKLLVTGLRKKKKKFNREQIVQELLQEFPLSSQEGVALMCLAEALLRVPDVNTRDALIKDKIKNKDWKSHFGSKKSLFLNSTIWGLCLTNTIIQKYTEKDLSYSLNNIIKRIGEPIIRKGINVAMQLMGKQFVVGENIQQALKNTQSLEKLGFTYSYDMLGESAVTEEDAQYYMSSYENAIHCIGTASSKKGIYNGAGISIKLSALYPRYFRAHYNQVMSELYPRLHTLTVLAKNYDIGMNIDAEESNRLEMSLDLLERLCCEPSLNRWNGIGFVIQAYQKRCMYVIDELIDIAQRTKRRLMIRLVKGAYWDSEIKNAQVEGIENYPVFTRKAYTDLSYLACAKKLLSKANHIYPQFATHNAQTVASIYHFAGNNYYPGQYEFQCLHGMGEQLYEKVVGKITDNKLNRPCRIYAPVGTHKTLLAYLVRRILENGANNSFINRISDHSIPIDKLIINPISEVKEIAQKENVLIGEPHPNIPVPVNLYGLERKNSIGLNLSNENVLAELSSNLFKNKIDTWKIYPKIAKKIDTGPIKIIINPANKNDIIGECQQSTMQDVESALSSSTQGIKTWSAMEPSTRSEILQESASKIENNMEIFIGLLIREAGKTFSNAISEIREAVDFLRYYAYQIKNFDSKDYLPLGCVICISPWNFPLAIFIGQISAALASGNVVIAKPAEQTPVVAYKAIQIMLDAGVPTDVLQFLPGSGKIIGEALSKDPRTHGIMFTGSTQVARLLQKNLSNRLSNNGSSIPLIAETGGLNAMIVDSSALTEQVIGDVIISAFDSAGQRCSALRLLCIQDDVADRTLHMLKGAINTYNVGNPDHLETDIGPVIDKNAKLKIDQHILNMQKNNHVVWQSEVNRNYEYDLGNFVLPTLIELNNISQIQEEIFGPVLHIIRYKYEEIDKIIQEINSTGYGLTLGIHSRIEEKIDKIVNSVKVGNIYVNRNIVGAVVGVQPFGGENLSGTGPKAGGLDNTHDKIFFLALKKIRLQSKKNKKFCMPRILDWRPIVHEMRLIKSEQEIYFIQKACNISVLAHTRAIQYCQPKQYEYEIVAEIHHEFLRNGCLTNAYNTIVGSGYNSCILHYTKNNKQMNYGELVLIDAGCEYCHYASDITRTIPVNGIFSKEQRIIYHIVLDMLNLALKLFKPNVKIKIINDQVISLLLLRLKSIRLIHESQIKKELQQIQSDNRISHQLEIIVSLQSALDFIEESKLSIKKIKEYQKIIENFPILIKQIQEEKKLKNTYYHDSSIKFAAKEVNQELLKANNRLIILVNQLKQEQEKARLIADSIMILPHQQEEVRKELNNIDNHIHVISKPNSLMEKAQFTNLRMQRIAKRLKIEELDLAQLSVNYRQELSRVRIDLLKSKYNKTDQELQILKNNLYILRKQEFEKALHDAEEFSKRIDILPQIVIEQFKKNHDLSLALNQQAQEMDSIAFKQRQSTKEILQVRHALSTLIEQSQWLDESPILGETLKSQMSKLPEVPKSQQLNTNMVQIRVQRLYFEDLINKLSSEESNKKKIKLILTKDQFKIFEEQLFIQRDLLESLLIGCDTQILELTKLKALYGQLEEAIKEIKEASHKYLFWVADTNSLTPSFILSVIQDIKKMFNRYMLSQISNAMKMILTSRNTWMFIQRRRIAFERAKQRRAEMLAQRARNTEEQMLSPSQLNEVAAEVDNKILDLDTISAKSLQLMVRNLPALLELALLQHLNLTPGTGYAITTLTKYGLMLLGGLIGFSIVGMEWSKLQWLAAALGVGLGFGLQEIFANFVSGLIILFEKPIRIGDTVTIRSLTGSITRINTRATTITDWDRKEIIVPNKAFITEQFVNWSLSDTVTRVVLHVPAPAESNIEKISNILVQAAIRCPLVLDFPIPEAFLVDIQKGLPLFELRIYAAEMSHRMPLRHQVNKLILDCYREHGIRLPYPPFQLIHEYK